MDAFIPMPLLASPRALEATRGGVPFDREEETVAEAGHYTLSREVRDGVEGWMLRLARPDPPLRTKYRISWTPPDELDGDGSRTPPH
jgi:hypothetical protein